MQQAVSVCHTLLQLLLGPEIGGVATLLLAAVLGPRVEPGIAPDRKKGGGGWGEGVIVA